MLLGAGEKAQAAQWEQGHLWHFAQKEKRAVAGKEMGRKQLGAERYLLFYIEEGTNRKKVILTADKGCGGWSVLSERLPERIREEGLRQWERWAVTEKERAEGK